MDFEIFNSQEDSNGRWWAEACNSGDETTCASGFCDTEQEALEELRAELTHQRRKKYVTGTSKTADAITRRAGRAG